MVEIRVALDDARNVAGLMRRLSRRSGQPSLSFDRSRKEVRVTSESELHGVVHVVDAVEAWLADEGAASATLSIGHRSYTLPASRSIGANS